MRLANQWTIGQVPMDHVEEPMRPGVEHRPSVIVDQARRLHRDGRGLPVDTAAGDRSPKVQASDPSTEW